MSLYSPVDFQPKTGNEAKIRISLGLLPAAFEALRQELISLIEAVKAMLAPYQEGAFLVTLTGVTATVQGDAYFVKHGRKVSLILPALSGTSNTTACTLTGLPAYLKPKRLVFHSAPEVRDNGTNYPGAVAVQTTGVMTLYLMPTVPAAGGLTATFTAAGTKGLTANSSIDYNLL